MRDLMAALGAVPTRAELRARIREPERFRPEPRLVRRLEVRVNADGTTDLILPNGKPKRATPIVLEVHRALEEGAPFDEIVRRAAPHYDASKEKVVAKLLRGYMLDLAEHGIVDIPFEEPPLVLAGRFERTKLLGRGAMGVVYLCRDLERGGAPVVLKRAWGWSTPIEKAERTNRHEAVVLSFLDHPLVPRVIATFEEDGLLHVVRDYAEGTPLLKQARGVAAMPTPERLAVWRDVCESVAHLHERGFVYLDAKPENFIRSPADGRTRLVDLGICRPMRDGRVELTGGAGSRGYASPEAVRQKHATPRSDIYGLGRILFFLATTARPRMKWTGDELARLMLEKGVDAREAELVRACSAMDPAARPADVRAVLDAIDAAREPARA